MEQQKVLRSNQEQAVAAWIHYLNQLRLDKFLALLEQQDINYDEAMKTVNEAIANISNLIISNRGGLNGLHGFIAEVAECGIGNAREQIKGNRAIYEWVNNNGEADIIRDGINIQMKFNHSGPFLSLDGVQKHLADYPDFLNDAAKYMIPKEQYERLVELLAMPADIANKLQTSNGDFSLKQYNLVHKFFNSGEICIDDIEPSFVGYRDVQRGQIYETMEHEKDTLKEMDQDIRKQLHEESKPTLKEGGKAVVVAAVLECGVEFYVQLANKRKQGKQIRDFDSEDWGEISLASGKSAIKGGTRGAAVYLLTNTTKTSAAVASAIVTAAFGVAEQAHLMRSGKIDETAFIENSELLCLDVSVSALSSFIGQTLIPVPVLGAIVGNTIGTMMYQIAKDNLSIREQELVKGYLESQQLLDQELKEKYEKQIEVLKEDLTLYMSILDEAFSPDVEEALLGSVKLAERYGVPSEELLKNSEEVECYFMN